MCLEVTQAPGSPVPSQGLIFPSVNRAGGHPSVPGVPCVSGRQKSMAQEGI